MTNFKVGVMMHESNSFISLLNFYFIQNHLSTVQLLFFLKSNFGQVVVACAFDTMDVEADRSLEFNTEKLF